MREAKVVAGPFSGHFIGFRRAALRRLRRLQRGELRIELLQEGHILHDLRAGDIPLLDGECGRIRTRRREGGSGQGFLKQALELVVQGIYAGASMNIAIQRDEMVLRVEDAGDLLVRRVEDELIVGDPFKIPSVRGADWKRQEHIVPWLSSS